VAETEKDNLQYRKATLSNQSSNYAETAKEVATGLTVVTTQKNALTTVLAALPNGQLRF
jgi:hypothetical protein